ncbi:MAG: glucose-6-phosphate dehydrogenase [Thermoleophilia bacterium]
MTSTAGPAAQAAPPFDLGARLSRTPAPAAVVIFGASGDLTHRKLMPALYNLAMQQLLPPEMVIVGFARTEWNDDQFREEMKKAVNANSRSGEVDEEVWAGFARRLHYISAGFDEPDKFSELHDLLKQADADSGTRGNRLCYLATAPDFFPVIAEQLGKAGINSEADGNFSRLVIEKPFGTDLDTARQLNARVEAVFKESQVYRIDHYLGKETVQNLLVLRFANSIFEPLWNRRYIDHVQITVAEELGVETRGGYYDKSGAMRDIVQNHIFQVLSIIAMEPPARFESRDVHDEKVKVLRAVTPIRREDVDDVTVRGQYAAGFIGGEPVPAYHDEQGVDPHSNTETYVAMRLDIDNWRWAGTPFYLRTGKRLPKRTTEVAIQFRPAPHLPFANTQVDAVVPNQLTMRIQPDEGASLKFAAKVPGPAVDIRTVSMDFQYGSSFLKPSAEAYERLLLDALIGDSTLFARWDEVERAWEIVEELLEAWRETPIGAPNYEAGTWGPEAADELLARDGREWRRL